MRVDQHRSVDSGRSQAVVDGVPVAGRTVVKARAYRTATEAASAAVIGVARGDLKVDVAEHRDGIAVRIATPLPVPNLNDSAAIAAGSPVLDRAREVQEDLQQRLTTLLGREVTRINLTITGASTPQRRRVQ